MTEPTDARVLRLAREAFGSFDESDMSQYERFAALVAEDCAKEVSALTYAARKNPPDGFIAACDSAERDGFRLGIGRAEQAIRERFK